MVTHLRHKSPLTPIILGGDLNLERKEMNQIETSLNLLIPQADDEIFGTHVNSYTKKTNQLDYFLISKGSTTVQVLSDFIVSDHRPLVLNINLDIRSRKVNPN